MRKSSSKTSEDTLARILAWCTLRRRLSIVVTMVLGAISLATFAACSSPLSPTPTPRPADVTPTPVASQVAAPVSSSPGGEVVVRLGEGSVARYVVTEQLANRNLPNDAVGETSEVNGSIAFGADGSVLSDLSKITVNLQSLTSDESRRDNYIRENALESNRFPMAELVVQDVTGLPWPLPDSGETTFQIVGDMTVHGVTQPTMWDGTAQFDIDGVTGQSRTILTFDQFGIQKPSLFFILSVEDEIRLELDFVAAVSPDS